MERSDLHFQLPSTAEPQRIREYERLRGNMLVNTTNNSGMKGGDPETVQPYVTYLAIVGHGEQELPVQVIWNAGPKFASRTIKVEEDKFFQHAVNHYGPMLFQAVMFFKDGSIETASIYCHFTNWRGLFMREMLRETRGE